MNWTQANDPVWWEHLEHLESEQPRKLSGLLSKEGALKAYLDRQVDLVSEKWVKLKKANPSLANDQLEELMRSEWESEPDPEATPLSAENEQKLDQFKNQAQDALESEPVSNTI